VVIIVYSENGAMNVFRNSEIKRYKWYKKIDYIACCCYLLLFL